MNNYGLIYNGYTPICYTPICQDSCYLASLGLHPQDLNSMNPSK